MITKVMISSLIEILGLLNFGHMNTAATELELREKILLMTSWTENMK